MMRDLFLLALLSTLVSIAAAKGRKRVWLMFGLAVLLGILLTACNMNYYGFLGSNPAPTGSPSGVYAVTIAGTFTPSAGSTTQGTDQQSTTVNLAVQ